MRRRDIEDITHVLARRKWLVVASVLVLATMSAVYAGIGKSGGVSSEISISIDEPIALTARPAEILDAGREAARLSDLVDTLVESSEDVAVRGDLLRRAVVVRATAPTQAEADSLATDAADAYIELRRAEFSEDLAVEGVLRRVRIEALQQQIDELDSSVAENSVEQSSALRDQRVQLVQQKLLQETELAAVELAIERADVGLTASPATAAGSSGGTVGLALFAVIGGLLGLLGGCAIALALDSLDHRLYTRRDVEAVAAGVQQHVTVLADSDHDGLERSELALLERVSPSGSVIVREPHAETEGQARLDVLGFTVVSDVGDVPAGAGVIVAVRHGVTTDIDLVHRFTALDVSGSPVTALLLYDVPQKELDWARRR